MKKNWRAIPLDELCHIEIGKTPSRSDKTLWDVEKNTNNVWLSIADLLNGEDNVVSDSKEYISNKGKGVCKIVKSGTLLASFKLTLGRLAFAGKDLFTNEAIAALTIRNEKHLSNEFLYYYLNYFDWQGAAEGDIKIKGKTLNKAKLKEIIIQFPDSLLEQQRIVSILDDASTAIATAKDNAEKNLQNASEIYQSILMEAITGRLTLDWRHTHSNTESASDCLKRSFNRRRKQWRGGEYTEPDKPVTNYPVDIPDSWTVASPEQITTHIVDCPHSTPKWTTKGVICLRTTNFKEGLLDLESVQFVSEETYKARIVRLEPKPGDVIYSREGGILGIACMIPPGLKMCLGQRMMHFRLDTSLALPEYFTAVLNSKLILSEVKKLTGGAASPHLNIRDIRRFPIPLPPIVEQYKIVEILDVTYSAVQHLESIYKKKLTDLSELKKSMLHKAFKGELSGAD